jgi:DNA ligase 1
VVPADTMDLMRLAELVATSRALASTRSRRTKVEALANALRRADSDEVETATAYLSGVLRQRRTGLGWRSLSDLPAPAEEPDLEVAEVHDAFEKISTLAGPGSKQGRADLVTGLFARATAEEQDYLRRLVTGELRQGALDGLMLEAIAAASGTSATAVRRAAMLCGATLPVAAAALTGGEEALANFGLEVGRPVRPMLASSAPDLPAGLERLGTGKQVAVDCKLDGIRLQVHKRHDRVSVFTRTLDDITDRLPEVVEAVSALPAHALVLDGEAIALDASGRPRPFQETAARTASRLEVETLRETVPLTSYFFDILHRDGADLLDRPASDRFGVLAETLPDELVVPRRFTDDADVVAEFFDEVVGLGHEGLVLKSLDAGYEAGRRGSSWVKVKPRHTLDLVVLAVEWGSGRRTGLLSNIHLGARDGEGGFVMLGKTFKGMTDEMLAWQTQRFLELETSRSSYVVHVRPEQVVEVAFDGIQTSSRYPAGMALRFARVIRYRDDKTAAEADTVDTVRSLHSGDG